MKRKMIGVMAGYMSGLFFVSFFTDGWQLIIPAVVFLIYVFIGHINGFSVRDFAIVSMSFAVAFTAGELYTHYTYNNIILYDGVQGNFSGIVTDFDIYDEDKARYIIKGKINNGQSAKVSFYTNELDAKYGDCISIQNATFKKISGNYIFDSESYYKSDNIFLLIEKADEVKVDKLNSYKIKNFLLEYKEKIVSDFRVKLGDECGGFLAGMVFGEKSFLDDDIKDSLYRTGIGHIMAVSGLHVSVMAMFVTRCLKRLHINKFISFWIVNVFMFVMVIMANAPVSAIRASIMFNIAYSSVFFRRKNDTFNSLAIAVLLMCILNPYVIYSQGFLLSITGTFGIGVFAPYMVKKLPSETFTKKFIRDFATMVCASVVIMPLSMLYFDEVSVFSPITNMLIVPLCTASMIIGMLYTFTGGILPILESAGGIIKIILFISEKISRFDFSYISCGNNFSSKLAFICLVTVIMIMIFTKNRRYISLSIVISVLFVFTGTKLYEFADYNKFKVVVLGRNDNAVVIVSYQSHNYIIDLDDYKNPDYADKYISENNIKSIEYLILHGSTQSLYPSYINKVNIINNCLAYGNIPPCGYDKTVTFNDSYEIKSDDYNITYSDDILRILYNGCEMTFISTKNEIPENRGLTVFYNKIVKDTVMQCDGKSIYLDEKKTIDYEYSGMNNFCVEFVGNGDFEISFLTNFSKKSSASK